MFHFLVNSHPIPQLITIALFFFIALKLVSSSISNESIGNVEEDVTATQFKHEPDLRVMNYSTGNSGGENIPSFEKRENDHPSKQMHKSKQHNFHPKKEQSKKVEIKTLQVEDTAKDWIKMFSRKVHTRKAGGIIYQGGAAASSPRVNLGSHKLNDNNEISHQSHHHPLLCPNYVPCRFVKYKTNWHPQQVRTLYSFVNNQMCQCSENQSCEFAKDDLILSAYVYYCRPSAFDDKTSPNESHDSMDINSVNLNSLDDISSSGGDVGNHATSDQNVKPSETDASTHSKHGRLMTKAIMPLPTVEKNWSESNAQSPKKQRTKSHNRTMMRRRNERRRSKRNRQKLKMLFRHKQTPQNSPYHSASWNAPVVHNYHVFNN